MAAGNVYRTWRSQPHGGRPTEAFESGAYPPRAGLRAIGNDQSFCKGGLTELDRALATLSRSHLPGYNTIGTVQLVV